MRQNARSSYCEDSRFAELHTTIGVDMVGGMEIVRVSEVATSNVFGMDVICRAVAVRLTMV
jgi:hypothetical protein